jgi:hypothetical protein
MTLGKQVFGYDESHYNGRDTWNDENDNQDLPHLDIFASRRSPKSLMTAAMMHQRTFS